MQTLIFAILGLAWLLGGFIWGLIMPGLRHYAWAILALGGLLLAAAVVFDFRRIQGALAGRRGKFGLSKIVKVALFCGILMFANAISVNLYHRFDFTGLAQFTLTSQTKAVLAGLHEPVEVVNFFGPSAPAAVGNYAANLLAEYQNHSNQLTVAAIDPDLNPEQARSYQVDQLGALYGVTVFRGKAGQRQVYGPQISTAAEHAFTSAILEVTGTLQKKIYFLTGHGEHSIQSDYSHARDGLRDNLFQIGDLDLLDTPAMPSDAAALVIAGPQRDLAAGELEILRDYLANDGRALILWDPDPPPWLGRLLADQRVNLAAGIVLDPESHVAPDWDTPLVPRNRNGFHLPEIYFPGAAAVFPNKSIPEGLVILPLIWTSKASWLEKTFRYGAKPEFNEHIDRKGPLPIGVMLSADTAGASQRRLVLIGDSDFAADRHFRNGNNSDLFLTALNWLTEGEQIISIDRKVLDTRRLLLNPDQARFLHLSSIGLLPLLLLVLGGYVWWRRR